MGLFRRKSLRMSRYVSTLRRSWLVNWWRAVKAVKNGIHIYEFLIYLYSGYAKHQPQTKYVNLVGDVEITGDGTIQKATDPIYTPPRW